MTSRNGFTLIDRSTAVPGRFRDPRARVRTPVLPGFTLIELLVVVTIIVVLLALLTPALDKAIYQAELAVCGAQQNGVVKGLTTYAAGFKRTYPYRLNAQVQQGSYPWSVPKRPGP